MCSAKDIMEVVRAWFVMTAAFCLLTRNLLTTCGELLEGFRVEGTW